MLERKFHNQLSTYFSKRKVLPSPQRKWENVINLPLGCWMVMPWIHVISDVYQVLDSGTNFFNSSGDICFWFILSPDRGNSKGFHLAFTTIIALTPKVREAKWEFCQFSGLSIPITHSGNKTSSETHRTHCESHGSQNAINHLTSRNSYFNCRATMLFGISQNQHQFRTNI